MAVESTENFEIAGDPSQYSEQLWTRLFCLKPCCPCFQSQISQTYSFQIYFHSHYCQLMSPQMNMFCFSLCHSRSAGEIIRLLVGVVTLVPAHWITSCRDISIMYSQFTNFTWCSKIYSQNVLQKIHSWIVGLVANIVSPHLIDLCSNFLHYGCICQ